MAVTEAPPEEGADAIDATRGPRSLVSKIAEAMAETERVQKDKRNNHDGYDYASIEVMLEEVRQPLFSRGVVLFSRPSDFTEEDIKSNSNKAGKRVIIEIDYTFTDGDNTFLIAGWKGEGVDYGDKAYGKAYTNAIKTFVRAQWMLPAGDDPEAESPERVANDRTPAWAVDSTDERRREYLAALAPIIGDHRATALAKATIDTYGLFPDLIVGFAKGLAQHHKSVQANGGVEAEAAAAARAQAEAAQAEAEKPDEAPDPEAARASSDASPEPAAATAEPAPESLPVEEPPPGTGEPPPAEKPPPAPASVPMPTNLKGSKAAKEAQMRALGCICEHPLKREGDNDQCPIEGHGIPF